MTPTLPTFSKNKGNKHKSLRSKQEFSAFNAKKIKIKREILGQILLTLHAAGQTWDSEASGAPGARAAGRPAPAPRGQLLALLLSCGRAAL